MIRETPRRRFQMARAKPKTNRILIFRRGRSRLRRKQSAQLRRREGRVFADGAPSGRRAWGPVASPFAVIARTRGGIDTLSLSLDDFSFAGVDAGTVELVLAVHGSVSRVAWARKHGLYPRNHSGQTRADAPHLAADCASEVQARAVHAMSCVSSASLLSLLLYIFSRRHFTVDASRFSGRCPRRTLMLLPVYVDSPIDDF